MMFGTSIELSQRWKNNTLNLCPAESTAGSLQLQKSPHNRKTHLSQCRWPIWA